ncbi:hypothetical protein [Nonomuraea sp. NPDC003201]
MLLELGPDRTFSGLARQHAVPGCTSAIRRCYPAYGYEIAVWLREQL